MQPKDRQEAVSPGCRSHNSPSTVEESRTRTRRGANVRDRRDETGWRA